MEQVLFSATLAFLTTFLAIPKVIAICINRNLFDQPDAVRKLHDNPVSSLGGIGIFLGFIISILLTINFLPAKEFQYYIACFIIIFFVGFKDDLLELTAFEKLISQSLVASILMFKSNLLITGMQGFLGIGILDTSVSFFLTFFTIVVIINAFNLIDGVDGLAASLGLLSAVVFGSFFLLNRDVPYAILAFGFAGSLFAFLIYNFSPAKIFMGDTGSLLIGVVNSILVIRFIENGSNYNYFAVEATPALGFSILLIPLLDTLRVFGTRMMQGRSPLSADRNHIHHILLKRGLSHRGVTYCCLGASMAFIIFCFFLQTLGNTWLVTILVSLFFGSFYIISRFWRPKILGLIKMVPSTTLSNSEDITSVEVI